MTTVVHKPKGLTPEIIAQLEALERMPDDTIDLSDMPERIFGPNAVRGKFYRPIKQQLTLRLDADVVHWFKTQGGGYQTRINQALRDYVEERSRKTG